MHCSIVIPTFNERENVRTMVQRIHEALADIIIDYEIWFIDDSQDDTPDVLAEMSETYPNVHYVHRTDARGLGTAVVEGFTRSIGEYIIVMDADLQHPPELLPIVMKRLQEGADVVIPSRFVQGGSDGGLNAFRKLVSWTARSIGRLAVSRLRGVSDCTGGYFGLKRTVVENAELDPIGWKILMEVLVKGDYKTVHEIPYRFEARDAGESKMSVKEQWNYLRHVGKLVWHSPEDRRFYLFCLIGGLGTLVNVLVMSILLYGFHWHPTAASVVASLVAMLHNFIWNDQVTWRGHAQTGRWRRFLQVPMFVGVSGVSIALTALFASAFLWIHQDALIGQCIGIVVSTLWSYTANNRWTWAQPKRPDYSVAKRPAISVTREKA